MPSVELEGLPPKATVLGLLLHNMRVKSEKADYFYLLLATLFLYRIKKMKETGLPNKWLPLYVTRIYKVLSLFYVTYLLDILHVSFLKKLTLFKGSTKQGYDLEFSLMKK